MNWQERQGQNLSIQTIENLSEIIFGPELNPQDIELWLQLRGLSPGRARGSDSPWPQEIFLSQGETRLHLVPPQPVGLGLFETAGVFQPPPEIGPRPFQYLARDVVRVREWQIWTQRPPPWKPLEQSQDPSLPLLGLTFSQAEAFARSLGLEIPQVLGFVSASPPEASEPRLGQTRQRVEKRIQIQDFLKDLAEFRTRPSDPGPFGHLFLGMGIQEWTCDRAEAWNPRTRPGRRMTFGFALDQPQDGTSARIRPQAERQRNFRVGFRLGLTLPPTQSGA